ncbi:MAG: hypothetical protein VXW36_05910 [Candidatus Thermoplasmatota archaeon]|nr:hypothetical protein [Candidatus Thermoplasmatota archaeon]
MGEGIKLPVINGLGRTDRIDNWWAQPFWMGLALTAALIYTAWRLILFPRKHFVQTRRFDRRLSNFLSKHPRVEFVRTQ